MAIQMTNEVNEWLVQLHTTHPAPHSFWQLSCFFNTKIHSQPTPQEGLSLLNEGGEREREDHVEIQRKDSIRNFLRSRCAVPNYLLQQGLIMIYFTPIIDRELITRAKTFIVVEERLYKERIANNKGLRKTTQGQRKGDALWMIFQRDDKTAGKPLVKVPCLV